MSEPHTKLTGILPLDSAIRDIDEVEDGYLLGWLQIAGMDFHASFVRVKTEEGMQVCDAAIDEESTASYGIFEQFKHLDEEPFQTIEVPGYPGDWVLVIQPFCT